MRIVPPPRNAGNRNLVRSTNRATKPSISEANEPDRLAMIDTIKVAWPIKDHWLTNFRFKRTVSRDGEYADLFTFGSESLKDALLQVRNCNQGLQASIERSVPSIIHGHNLHPATIEKAKAVVADLYDQASEYVEFACDPLDGRVTRLDLDRGFVGVEHPEHLLTGLARLRVSRSANPRLYYNEGALTLERRTTSRTWGAVLYDKRAQMVHLADHARDSDWKNRLLETAELARGHLRFEAQLRSRTLRERGITTMNDLDEQILLSLREEIFRRARFDTPVGGADRLNELQVRLACSGDPGYKSFGQVVAMLRAEALGVTPPTTGSATLAKYRALAREWGLSAADVLTTSGPAIALDYETGALRSAS